MGKIIIIKGADFSTNSIGVTEIPESDFTKTKISEQNVISNYYINAQNGNEVALSGWKYQNYTEIPKAAKKISGITNYYKNSAVSTLVVGFYNSDKQLLSVFEGTTNNSGVVEISVDVAIPSQAKYIRFCWNYAGAGTDSKFDFPELYFE